MKVKILSAIFVAPVFFALVAGAQSQQEKSSSDNGAQSVAQQVKTGKEYLGPIAESIRPYRPTNRDPFKRTPKVVKQNRAKALATRMLGFPTLDARRAEFRQKVQQAVAADRPEPDPVSQYLVSEVDITGVFRDDRGFGAFVRAQPSGTMFFVRNGSRLYNGEVVRIAPDDGEGTARVQFREVSYAEVNGKQLPQERMVTKSPAGARH
jgi:hypothetical protein